MANINIKYPDYPKTESYEICGKTYVADYVAGHPAVNKIVIHFDTYSGNSGGSVKRVGELFKVGNGSYADFVVNNTQYVLDVRTGTIYSMVDFSIKTNTPIRIIKGLKPCDDNTLNELLLRDDKTFRYQILGRFQSDCQAAEYFAGDVTKRLWTHSVSKQIYYMKALYYSFKESEKPEWISIQEIDRYEKVLSRPIMNW